jgi:preprotein translocase subunit SecG
MISYYINNGNENGGPFTIEELKLQDISRATLVWYNGMDEWKYAGEIGELQFLFKVTPPPIKPVQKTSSPLMTEPRTILGLKKSHFILAVAFAAIMIFILVLTIIQNNKRSILEERNRQTELANEKVQLEQKADIEQRIQDEIQNKIATENNNNFKKDSINNRLVEVKALLIEKKRELNEADTDLMATKRFKILRSEEDKSDQISAAQNTILVLKKEIDNLESELNRLYLQLETIH